MPDRPAGALIGRIGTSPDDTFFIGAERLPFRVRTSGRLYLGESGHINGSPSGAVIRVQVRQHEVMIGKVGCQPPPDEARRTGD